jgi:2-keto-3-deoxy-L-rhamnonate aldolase RhmA
VLPDALHPQVQEAVRHVRDRAKAARIPIGISAGYNVGADPGMDFWLNDLGVDFAFAGSDLSLIANGAKRTFDSLKRKNG